jgi:hypothetical protein
MTQADAIARMRAEMDHDDGSAPPLWNADDIEGEQLVGELIRIEDRDTKIGVCKVAIVYDAEADETWSVFLTRSVLKNEFDKQKPRSGDTVGIKYFGKRNSRGATAEYHNYRVRVARAPGNPAPAAAATTANDRADDADADLGDVPF